MRVTAIDVALAMVFGALIGVYVLQNAQAASASETEALGLAMAKRDETARLLEEAKETLARERELHREELANLTATLGIRSLVDDNRRTDAVSEADEVWSDFPCALRELKVAKVTKTCEVACRDPKCERAQRICDRLVECDAVLVEDVLLGKASGDLGSKTARLVRNVAKARARDTSMKGIEASKWWGSSALKTDVRQRTYIVVSYGGCGSKMLAGWLSNLPSTKFLKRVYHFHDAKPPKVLHELPVPRAPPSSQRDFRARRFPGGGRFRDDTPVITDLDAYRILFIFKDPVEALVSRYGYGHCLHLDGDCGPDEASFPKLPAYARQGRDAMGILAFFDHYARPPADRSFPVVLLNYHKLWDNLDAVLLALGLPNHLKSSFPERTETVRNDLTARAEQNQAHSEATRQGLDTIYRPILDQIRSMPAVSIV